MTILIVGGVETSERKTENKDFLVLKRNGRGKSDLWEKVEGLLSVMF